MRIASINLSECAYKSRIEYSLISHTYKSLLYDVMILTFGMVYPSLTRNVIPRTVSAGIQTLQLKKIGISEKLFSQFLVF